MITSTLLQQMGVSTLVAEQFAEPLAHYTLQYGIDTSLRQMHFLAQILHESGELTRLIENLNYSAKGLLKTWPKRFTPERAEQYARKPELIANYVYANRLGNGSPASGDGWRYRGRGPIQCTGRDNYKLLSAHTGIDYIQHPEWVLRPDDGSRAACWFWQRNAINQFADADNLKMVTQLINGGNEGFAVRQLLLDKAKTLLTVAS